MVAAASIGARATGQPSSSARACRTRPASSSGPSVVTRTAPALRMPTFSRAIAARVGPRISVCSSSTLVTTAISPSTILVEFEPSADADFDRRPFEAGLLENDQGGGGHEVEPGRLGSRRHRRARGLVGVQRAFQPVRQRQLADRAPVDAHTLGHMLDMRRPVAADPRAGAHERGLDQRRDRALALGAGDMN